MTQSRNPIKACKDNEPIKLLRLMAAENICPKITIQSSTIIPLRRVLTLEPATRVSNHEPILLELTWYQHISELLYR
jgi:hypothetical protein